MSDDWQLFTEFQCNTERRRESSTWAPRLPETNMKLLLTIAALGLIAAPAVAQNRTHSPDSAYDHSSYRSDSDRHLAYRSDRYGHSYNDRYACRERYSSYHRSSYRDRQRCERSSYHHSRYRGHSTNNGNYRHDSSDYRPHG